MTDLVDYLRDKLAAEANTKRWRELGTYLNLPEPCVYDTGLCLCDRRSTCIPDREQHRH